MSACDSFACPYTLHIVLFIVFFSFFFILSFLHTKVVDIVIRIIILWTLSAERTKQSYLPMAYGSKCMERMCISSKRKFFATKEIWNNLCCSTACAHKYTHKKNTQPNENKIDESKTRWVWWVLKWNMYEFEHCTQVYQSNVECTYHDPRHCLADAFLCKYTWRWYFSDPILEYTLYFYSLSWSWVAAAATTLSSS